MKFTEKQPTKVSNSEVLSKHHQKQKAQKSSDKPHGAYVERSEAEVERLNNPLGSLGNWDYISEKLNAHKEIVEPYGSKVPTPILKDLYK